MVPTMRLGVMQISLFAARGLRGTSLPPSACCAGGIGLEMGGLATAQQIAEAGHVAVDDRRREQCQQLRYQEAADDCVTERLANFRADAGAEHQRHTAEQSAHR